LPENSKEADMYICSDHSLQNYETRTEIVLEPLALEVVQDLVRAGLPDVDQGLAAPMEGRYEF
jgi:hypothetical protein